MTSTPRKQAFSIENCPILSEMPDPEFVRASAIARAIAGTIVGL